MKTKLIICPREYKNDLLLQNKSICNQKFMTLKDYIKHYYFDYHANAIYYLMKKYHYHIDICKVYLDNMIYIEDKEYKSSKCNFLKELKKECIDNNLLEFHPLFKDSIKNYDIEVKNYYHIEKQDRCILNVIEEVPTFSFKKQVYEFNSMEKEIHFVCQEIRKLLNKNIPMNKIFLVNVEEEYYFLLSKIFSYYHIPIEIPFQNPIYATKTVQKILQSKEPLQEITNKVEKKYSEILKDLSDLEQDEIYDIILKDRLKNTYLSNSKYEESIKILDLTSKPFQDDEYVFVLGFNQDALPKTKKDVDYLSDEDKKELGLETSMEWNKREREVVPYLLSKIKNCTITYKCTSPFENYYPSSIIKDYQLEVVKNPELSNQYSHKANELKLADLLDDFHLYGEKNQELIELNSNYDIGYHTYENQFTGINRDTFLENLNVPFRVSYSSLNQYAECKFKYYINSILKLNPYEDSFPGFIGSLYHKILSLRKRPNFDLDREWNNYLEKRELTIKEKTLLVRIRKDLEDIIHILEKQDLLTDYQDELCEQPITIPLRSDISTEFIGYIDKIMYYKNMNDTYFSIVDYKSGDIDTKIEPMKYGLHMQLPIYLYLIHYGDLFDNPIFTGIYYQNILFSYPAWSPKLAEQEEKKYYLQGYSTDKLEILEKFDNTYQNSELIKSMKYQEDKGFGSYTKLMNDDTLLELIKYTKNIVEKETDEILNADFQINPKVYGKDNVSCELCKFKDLCFHKNEDIIRLPKVDDLSFLGGDE